jgi:predicted transcriptional regulator
MEKLFSSNVITVKKDSSVFEALQKMKFNSIKRIVIVEERKPLGIITERDINKFLKNDKTARAINEIPVMHMMEKNLVLITDDLEDDFYQCASKMENLKIGSVILIDEHGNLSGIVTRTDLVKAYADLFGGKYLVKEFMSKKILTCRKSDSLKLVLQLLDQNNVSRLVVIDKIGNAVGLISTNTLINNSDYFTRNEKDSRDYLLPSSQDTIVDDLLDDNIVTIKEDEDLAKAAILLTRYKISGLPVLDLNSKLVGVISKTDIVRAFSDVEPHELLQLKYKEMY